MHTIINKQQSKTNVPSSIQGNVQVGVGAKSISTQPQQPSVKGPSLFVRAVRLAEGKFGKWSVEDCGQALRDPARSHVSKRTALDTLIDKGAQSDLTIAQKYSTYGAIKYALDNENFDTDLSCIAKANMFLSSIHDSLHLKDPLIQTAFAQSSNMDAIGSMIDKMHTTSEIDEDIFNVKLNEMKNPHDAASSTALLYVNKEQLTAPQAIAVLKEIKQMNPEWLPLPKEAYVAGFEALVQKRVGLVN